MPKSIDNIGRRPNKKQVKPVSKYEAGEVVRPKGEPAQVGRAVKPKGYVDPHLKEVSSNTYVDYAGIDAGKKPKPHKERWYKKLTKKQKIAIGSGVTIALSLIAVVAYILLNTQLFTAWNRPRPADGVFAEVGGETISEEDFANLKDSYVSFYSKSGESDVNSASRTASRAVIEGLALRAEARKHNINCTQEIVDSRLTDRYAEHGGKEQYYEYLQKEYGWGASAVFWQECSDYYRQQLAEFVGGTDVYGVYIRWDIHKDKDSAYRKTFEEAAKKRLETDYLPLLKSPDAVVDDIERRVDLNKYMTGAEFDSKIASPDQPYTRSMEISKFNEATYAEMDKYDEGEDDIAHISKLNIGETTPVFKSKVGYYIVYRALSKADGQFESIDSLIDSYIQSGKYSNTYYSLPPHTENGNDIDIYNITNKQSGLDKLRDQIIPKALAAPPPPNSIACFTGVHGLPFRMELRDYSTRQLIPLAGQNAKVTLASTTNMRWPCSDELAAGSYFNGVVNIAYTPGNVNNWSDPNASQIVYYINPLTQNPWTYTLSCYTAWRHYIVAPNGYKPPNYADASQFEVIIARGNGTTTSTYTASEEGSNFRVPQSLYSGVANGARGYTIRVYLRKNPPPPPPPRMTIQGHKVNESNNPNGPYSDNTIRLDGGARITKTNPYSLPSIRADQNHTVTADPEPGFDLIGYRVNGGAITSSTTYSYSANQVGNGASIRLDWVYRPKLTGSLSITCSTISGSVSGPSGATLFIRVSGVEVARQSGSSISYTVADNYRDGLSRQVRLYVNYMGSDFLLDTKNHGCAPNAICDVADFSQLQGSVDGGQSYQVTMRFKNTGEAYWKDYGPSNKYHLAMIDGSQGFDSVSTGLDISPPGTLVKSNQTASFTVPITAKNNVTTSTVRLAFQMTRSSGGTLNNFGATCETTVRFRKDYSPWIRTQNGNVSALGVITGQGSLKVDGADLGGRRDVGSASGSHKDDLNYEASYSVAAQQQDASGVINSALSSGPFCSTNAYVLGRDDASTTTDNSSSCSFGVYAFNLRNGLNEGLKKNGDEVIYREALDSYTNSPDSCPAGGPNPNGTDRYAKGDPGYDGSSNLPGLDGLCPTITVLNKRNPSDSQFILGRATGAPALLVPRARTTILVNGDLYINADIINGSLPAIAYNRGNPASLNPLPNQGIIVNGDIIIDRDVKQIDAALYSAGQIKTCDLYNPADTTSNSLSTSTGFKPEQPGGPTGPNPTASQCANQRLTIHGMAAAKEGYQMGRNYIDFAGISSNIGRGQYSSDFDFHPDGSLYYGKPAEDVIFNGLLLFAPPPGFEHVTSPDFTSARYFDMDVKPQF